MPAQVHSLEAVHALLADADPEKRLAPCGLRDLVLGPDALDQVTAAVSGLLAASAAGDSTSRPRVALLVDRTPIHRHGVEIKGLLEQQLRERFTLELTVLDDGQPELHVVDEVLDAATEAVRGVDAVVALGGGTISDIGKVAAQRVEAEGHELVLVSVQTAASVDGYTDDVSVVLRDGVKRTVPSRWPDVVVADSATIAEAPATMNRAGFGEMTSMLIAPADWRLASLVGTESKFHRAPIRLLAAVGSDLHEWAPGVGRDEPDAVERLTRALAFRGIATGVSGTTAVLSGMEHLVSHMLDLHHAEHHLPMGLHGAQVGAASVVGAAAWEMLFERMTTGEPCILDAALDEAAARERVESAFLPLDPTGRIAKECWSDYATKLQAVSGLRGQIEALLADWSERAPELRELVWPSLDIAGALRVAGAAATFAALTPRVDPTLARWAVANCGLMRNRFTVVDLLTLLGWWTANDIDEVLERAGASAAAAGLTES